MNLIIDVGNSLVKLAVFNGNLLVETQTTDINSILDKISNLKLKYDRLKDGIISSVANISKSDLKAIHEIIHVLVLNNTLRLPFNNLYATPQTLGVDRLALVGAAVNRFPNTNCLVIDAGTCITYDFITSKANYLGGAISPGIRMRYKALNTFTAKLPLLTTESPNNIIGDSTNQSIHSGVVFGVIKEIEGVIGEYQKKYPDLTVILTGGDGNFLSKQLKSSIFANSNFLLEGLNLILQLNSNE
ncbi:type III pantothenate kinase [Gaetbulibacter saemankumensis]|uniref:type III pantothenate kinase n=1 Tax=Gaetbulibacter saemankumensis TaxID=311208 RepID=UPI0004047369|nr:type III pantothenate kinase [Gaetbulibacter saemankumensis]